MLWHFNTVTHVVQTPNQKITPLLLHNYNFVTVMNQCKCLIYKLSDMDQRGHDLQVENPCVRGELKLFLLLSKRQSWVKRAWADAQEINKWIQENRKKLSCGYRQSKVEKNRKLSTWIRQEKKSLWHFSSVSFKTAKKTNIRRWRKMEANFLKGGKKNLHS